MATPKEIPRGPHQSVVLITISAEIMERLPNGMCSGIPVERQNESILLTIKSGNKEDCSQATKELIETLKERITDGETKKEEQPEEG